MIFLAITLWLLNGHAFFEQKEFKTLDECMAHGSAKVVELQLKNAEILFGSCFPVKNKEV